MAKSLVRGVGDVLGWLTWIKQTIQDLKTDGDIKTGDLMEKYAEKLAAMAADVGKVLEDGFQFEDTSVLAELVPEIMQIAKDIAGVSGADKHEFVVDTVWLIYHSVDTGPDGKHNRIRVPGVHWLSKFGITSPEEKVERFILRLATEFAMKPLYAYMKEKDEV